jgi:hypothetical protein
LQPRTRRREAIDEALRFLPPGSPAHEGSSARDGVPAPSNKLDR